MKQPRLVTYQKFMDRTAAAEFLRVFDNHSIAYDVEDSSVYFDPSFARNAITQDFRILISPKDYARADEAIEKHSEAIVSGIGRQHYLYSYTNTELHEILTLPDEWGKVEYLLARQILVERGETITNEMLAAYRAKRIVELKKPNLVSERWILPVYVYVVAGGILGIFLGWQMMTMRKTLFNGEVIPVYSEKDQRHGLRIFVLSIICFTAYFIFLFIRFWQAYS